MGKVKNIKKAKKFLKNFEKLEKLAEERGIEYLNKGLDSVDLETSMPNVPLKVMGGEFCWETVLETDGLKVQCNSFIGNYRILNGQNVRKAWGTEEQMNNYLEAVAKKLK